MDNIAGDLGISKKTIYQYFDNKAHIIVEVMAAYVNEEKKQMEIVARNSENAVDEMAKIVRGSIKSFKGISPSLIYDIQKYYPKAWEVFEDYKSNFILQEVFKNLVQGIEEGVYRASINPEIISRLRVAQIDMSLRKEYFPLGKFDFTEVQIQMLEMYLHGIVTDKGRQLLTQYLQREGV